MYFWTGFYLLVLFSNVCLRWGGFLISIPIWFDWEISFCLNPYLIVISIPIWFDWETQESGLYLLLCISIPIWFDWGNALIAKANLEEYFNSYMVRLRGTDGIQSCALCSHFNSYMVRLRVLTEFIQKAIIIFQFLWFDWENYLDSRSAGPNHFNSYMVRLREVFPTKIK